MTRKHRSSPYPSYTIEHCIELVAKIYSNFGSGNYYAKREEIAKVFNKSAAHLQTQVSSANQYGLLDLKKGMGYKPSILFLSIYRPTTEESKKIALIEAFKSPSLYSSLIEKFEGEILPTEVPLSNILLHHHNISEGANEKAAEVFIANARYLNLVTSDNVLLIANYSESKKPTETNIEHTIEEEPVKNLQGDKNNVDLVRLNKEEVNFESPLHRRTIPFNIPLKGNRTAQIIVPNDVKSTDFDFMINFINLMKQQFE